MLKKLRRAVKAARAAEIEAKAATDAADAWAITYNRAWAKAYIDADAVVGAAAEDARAIAYAEDARVAARARVHKILEKMLARYS